MSDIDRIDELTIDDGMKSSSDSKSASGKKNRSSEEDDKITEFYSERLKFLWEQYIKLIGFGILSAGITLALIIQSVLNDKIRNVIISAGLNSCLLKAAVVAACFAILCFIACRWCSQILMERQVYGNADKAIYYFETILKSETILPSALQPKHFISSVPKDREGFLGFIGSFNEGMKWTGVISNLISWFFCICYIFPLLDMK